MFLIFQKMKIPGRITAEERLNSLIKNDKILTKIYKNGMSKNAAESFENKNNEDLHKTKRSDPINVLAAETGSKQNDSKMIIIWHNVFKFAVLHVIMLYGLYLIFSLKVSWKTTAFAYVLYVISCFGVTAGSHRLWSHRSYKANLRLRIFLMLCHTLMFENNIYHWCREHRTHHKYSDTSSDPHNSKKGIFYSHIGWVMVKKTKDVLDAGKTIDYSDILGDPVVQFQIKYYYFLVVILTFGIPTFIPWYYWSEDLWYSFIICVTRFMWGLNNTFLVNSLAHAYGNKPYDKSIASSENKFVSILALGEGWHNYHHVFPWDYKAAELGNYGFNFTTCFLDLMAKIGWATELKTASKEIIKKRILRTGDGSHKNVQGLPEDDVTDNIWGWGDKDMNEEEKKNILSDNQINSY